MPMQALVFIIWMTLILCFCIILAEFDMLRKYKKTLCLIGSIPILLIIWLLMSTPNQKDYTIEYVPIVETPQYYIFTDPVTKQIHNVNKMFGVRNIDENVKIKIIRRNMLSLGIYWDTNPKYELE